MFYFSGTRKENFKNVSLSSHIFDEYWKKKGFAMRSKLMDREKIFFEWIKKDSQVLSIGCGNSRLLHDLKTKKNCAVYGVDLVQDVVDELKKNDIKCYQANVSSDDFFEAEFLKDNKFDYIVISELLHQLKYPEKLLSKLSTKTEKFILSLPNSAFYRYRFGLLFGGRFFTQWNWHPSETLRYWSYTDFVYWLEALGMEIVDCQSSNGFSIGPIKFYKFWKNMFAHQICYLVKVKNK